AALREAAKVSFEKVPTQQVLAELLDELGEHERTNILGATDPPPAEASPDPSDLVTGQAAARVPSAIHSAETQATPSLPEAAPSTPPAIALVTAAALATDSAMRRTVSKPRGVMAIGAAAGALVVAGLLFAFTRGAAPREAETAGSATHATSSGTLPPPATAPVVSTAAAAWTAVPLPPPPSEKPVTALPLASPSPASTLRPRPAAAPAPAAPVAAPAKPSCNPPYEFDQDGNKRWKRECL